MILKKLLLYTLALAFTCCKHQPKELTYEEKEAAREKEYKDRQEALQEKVQFNINGVPFKASGLGYKSELKMDETLHQAIFRFYFVDVHSQALEILFFADPPRKNIPFTFLFKDNNKTDPGTFDWAVVSFTSGQIPGWHKVPRTGSITITEWDQDHRTISGEFFVHLENSEDKSKSISITEGKFTKLPYSQLY